MPIPVFVAAAIGIARVAPIAMTTLRVGGSAVGRYLTGSPTRVGIFAAAAAPTATVVGLKVVEHETGGGVTDLLFDKGADYLKGKIKEGFSVRQIEEEMDKLEYISDINGAYKKGAQNLYVRQVMAQYSGDEAVANGKKAALSFQLIPDNMAILTGKQFIRRSIADDMFKDKNEADKYLANGLIDDLVKNAQVKALNGHQVSRDDVRDALKEVVDHPSEHPVAAKFLREGRMANGLKQVWPELWSEPRLAAVTPSAAPTETPPVPSRRENEETGHRSRSHLREAFDTAADNDDSMMNMLLMFMVALFQMMGLGKNQASTPDENRPTARLPAALTPHPSM